MTLHVGSPVVHPERIRAVIANLRATFAVVVPYLTSIPLYGGLWMMACASSTLNPAYLTSLEADRRVATRRIRDCGTTTATCIAPLSHCRTSFATSSPPPESPARA